MVIGQENLNFFHHIGGQKKADIEKDSNVNYLKLLNRCGIHATDHILVIGLTQIELLQMMVSLVGLRGSITLLINDPIELKKVQEAANAGLFKAFNHLAGRHPSPGIHKNSEKVVTVEIKIEQLSYQGIPFEDGQFNFVWVAQSLDALTSKEARRFSAELKRVIKKLKG